MLAKILLIMMNMMTQTIILGHYTDPKLVIIQWQNPPFGLYQSKNARFATKIRLEGR